MMLAEFVGAPNVKYVRNDGNDANNGDSWSTAYQTITKAVAPPNVNPSPSNITVLVAPGTYDEAFSVKGSNVAIVGAGPGTYVKSNSGQVIGLDGSNCLIQDLQVVNTHADTGAMNHNGIARTLGVHANFRLCNAHVHGEAACFFPALRSQLVTWSILSGYENAFISQQPGDFVSSALQNTIASNTIFRIAPEAPRTGSPSVHLSKCTFTAMNCSMVTVSKQTSAPPTSLTGKYHAILVNEQGVVLFPQVDLFGCALGVRSNPEASYSDASSFVGLTAGKDVHSLSVGCLVRAVGPPNALVAAFKDDSVPPDKAELQRYWTLEIPSPNP